LESNGGIVYYGECLGNWRVDLLLLFHFFSFFFVFSSNFNLKDLQELTSIATIQPQVVQVWFDPFEQPNDILAFCKKNDIVVQAYSALGSQWLYRGQKTNPVFRSSVIREIAEKKGKNNAQIVLRWLTQKRITVIPRSKSFEHMKQNRDIWDFELNESEMTAMNQLRNTLK